jgi:hypothetical protein
MVIHCYRARAGLPKNFEYIALDKKAQEALHNLGVEYHQPRIRNVAGVVEDE